MRYLKHLLIFVFQEEFDGFSEADVACVVKKLQDLENELHELTKPVTQKPELSNSVKPVSVSDGNLKKQNKRQLKKAAGEKTYKQLIKEGHAKPLKEGQVRKGKVGRPKKLEHATQKVRFHFKGLKTKGRVRKAQKTHKLRRRDSKRSPKRKSEHDKSMDSDDDDDDDNDDDIRYTISSFCDNDSEAKEETGEKPKPRRGRPPLLSKQKLKENQKKAVVIPRSKKVDTSLAKQLLSRAKRVRQEQRKNSPPSVVQRRQFVLPTVSSRSSRKIIPNKRFIEDGVEGVIFSSPVTNKPADKPSEANTVVNPVPSTGSPSVKRGRKPSVKILQKLNDEDITDAAEVTKPSRKKVIRHSENESKATQKRGRSILQKAKLRLNQATLNKSKVALARSLKRQMKKDDQKRLVSSDIVLLWMEAIISQD